MNIAKKKYLGKYDFLRSLNRPKNLWFLSDDEILSALSSKHETNEDEENEFDAVEYLRQKQSDSSKGLANEKDARIIEGKKIDLKARKFICENYQKIVPNQPIKICDFDKLIEHYRSLEEKFAYFKQMVDNSRLSKQHTIFFQPTLLDEKRMMVTKPDALVWIKGQWELIEVKGVTTSKRHHLLDLLFQRNVILHSGLNINIAKYYLCVVAYKKGAKNDVDFIFTETFIPLRNYTEPARIKNQKKSWSKFDESIIRQIQNEKIGMTKTPVYFSFFLQDRNFNSLLDQKKFKNWIQFYYENIYEKFDSIIQSIHDQKLKFNQTVKIEPSWEFCNFFKNFEYLPQLKQFLTEQGYSSFRYSGKVLCWTYAMLVWINQLDVETTIKQLAANKNYLDDYLQKEIDNHPNFFRSQTSFSKIGIFYSQCLQSHQKIYMNRNKVQTRINLIKKNKVYFDFETISSAISIIDNLLPFTQIITQCSILKEINGQLEAKCLNLIMDPKKITISFFKKIIDELYLADQTSYIVYNKSFEQTRLQELIEYIDDEKYQSKIRKIIDNIFDLADFFNLSQEMICIKELYGNYSIKRILPLILSDLEIVQATGVIDYNKLAVKKGDQCQNITIQRFHDLIKDNEWNQITQNLQKYCENDVRVMVALEYYVRKQLKKYL